MTPVKTWDGSDLEGEWLFTYKLDGVRAIIKEGVALSRAGKPLRNLPLDRDGDFEVFTGSWEGTIGCVRGHMRRMVRREQLYSLEPLDLRLLEGTHKNPRAELVGAMLGKALALGHEGLVLRQGDTWLKVKPRNTYDVPVTGVTEGKGRNVGRLGALVTPLGKVGTGFTDERREQLASLPLGTVIEVACMELTPNGKFRHPRFVRVRWDK